MKYDIFVNALPHISTSQEMKKNNKLIDAVCSKKERSKIHIIVIEKVQTYCTYSNDF